MMISSDSGSGPITANTEKIPIHQQSSLEMSRTNSVKPELQQHAHQRLVFTDPVAFRYVARTKDIKARLK